MHHSAPAPPDHSRWQEVLNESWPPADVARRLRDVAEPIAVTVRLELDQDGEVRLQAQAVRWWQQHVCVYLIDPRLQARYVWVDAADVTGL